MIRTPEIWPRAQLTLDANVSIDLFRRQRLDGSDAWRAQYTSARRKFDTLLEVLGDLGPDGITHESLAKAYQTNLGDALRYLAGPPISDDDLKVIADATSIEPNALIQDPNLLRKVYAVIEKVIDPFRFPWIEQGRHPTDHEREAALLASAVLLASQRVATERRSDGKAVQESRVKEHLRAGGFTEVAPATINTLVNGPQAMQFCGECQLGDRKADIVLRLHDTRLMAIECKVSNSATNSVKRLNNDAAVKADYWLSQFGKVQIVPAAMLSGVFKVVNLEQAQSRGLALFWAHDMSKLSSFIESTRAQ